jgi:hypothetical protein
MKHCNKGRAAQAVRSFFLIFLPGFARPQCGDGLPLRYAGENSPLEAMPPSAQSKVKDQRSKIKDRS